MLHEATYAYQPMAASFPHGEGAYLQSAITDSKNTATLPWPDLD